MYRVYDTNVLSIDRLAKGQRLRVLDGVGRIGDVRMYARPRSVDYQGRRRRQGSLPGLPAALGVRAGGLRDPGSRGAVGRHLDTRGRPWPQACAQATTRTRRTERVPRSDEVTDVPDGWPTVTFRCRR